jgi:hypothetical protein
MKALAWVVAALWGADFLAMGRHGFLPFGVRVLSFALAVSAALFLTFGKTSENRE